MTRLTRLTARLPLLGTAGSGARDWRCRERKARPPRRRVLAIAAVLALAAGACGPERPFELGLKEVPSDLLLGRQTKPAAPLPAQLPPVVFFTDTAGPTSLPTPTAPPPPLPPPPPPPPACPSADPLAPARLPVTTDVPRPPVPATYEYRASGFVVSAQSRNLPTTATHEVRNVVPIAPGEFTFDVAVTHEGTTVTTYHVVPRTSTIVPPGLYIQRINDFAPKPELLVVPFPALPGMSFAGGGSDGRTTMHYDGVVEATERIDACGTNIDAIRVRLVGRATTGRSQDGTFLAEEFEASYLFATQYGGLVVRHVLKASMPGDVDLAAREVTGSITREPEEPR